jgi:hypothetical protein
MSNLQDIIFVRSVVAEFCSGAYSSYSPACIVNLLCSQGTCNSVLVSTSLYNSWHSVI